MTGTFHDAMLRLGLADLDRAASELGRYETPVPYRLGTVCGDCWLRVPTVDGHACVNRVDGAARARRALARLDAATGR